MIKIVGKRRNLNLMVLALNRYTKQSFAVDFSIKINEDNMTFDAGIKKALDAISYLELIKLACEKFDVVLDETNSTLKTNKSKHTGYKIKKTEEGYYDFDNSPMATAIDKNTYQYKVVASNDCFKNANYNVVEEYLKQPIHLAKGDKVQVTATIEKDGKPTQVEVEIPIDEETKISQTDAYSWVIKNYDKLTSAPNIPIIPTKTTLPHSPASHND